MKRFTLPLIAAALAATAMSSFAADGTIHFNGSVTDATCNVSSGSQNLNVDLGKVAKSALNGASGMQASATRFTIDLTGCPDTVNSASLKFDGKSDALKPNLLALDSGTGVATGVGIQIADNTGTPINLHTTSRDYTLQNGDNQLDFTARYVSTGATVTSGTANATSQFTINYK